MILFLYLGFLCALIIIIFLLNKQTKLRPKTKNISKFVVMDLIIGLLVLGFVGGILPYIMWTFSSKDIIETEMIVEEGQISPIENDIYIKEKKINDAEVYLINIGNDKEKDIKYISKDRAVIKGKASVGATEYQEVIIYNSKRISGDGSLAYMLNDMFANIYIKNKDAVYKDRKVNIYLPSGYKIGKEQ